MTVQGCWQKENADTPQANYHTFGKETSFQDSMANYADSDTVKIKLLLKKPTEPLQARSHEKTSCMKKQQAH